MTSCFMNFVKPPWRHPLDTATDHHDVIFVKNEIKRFPSLMSSQKSRRQLRHSPLWTPRFSRQSLSIFLINRPEGPFFSSPSVLLLLPRDAPALKLCRRPRPSNAASTQAAASTWLYQRSSVFLCYPAHAVSFCLITLDLHFRAPVFTCVHRCSSLVTSYSLLS